MVPVLLMIGAGIAIASAVMVTIGIASRMTDQEPAAAGRETIAASLLFDILLAGGDRPDEAMRDIRRIAGIGAPVASAVDIASWGQRFAQMASPEQRAWLLDMAVQLIASRGRTVSLRQYSALLDLNFALGFQTDALAKLRERYPFEYVDHAKNARPREAVRGGGSLPLFVRDPTETVALLRILGLEQATATRQTIISTYRRLASQHHPDRVFGEPADIQSESAARFIEITRAYEALLAIFRD